MKKLIEKIKAKADSLGVSRKEDRRVKGVYVDCLLMAEEELNTNYINDMFDFANYLYGNFDYHDNTKDGDIYIHNDNGLQYTREQVYKQWVGVKEYLGNNI